MSRGLSLVSLLFCTVSPRLAPRPARTSQPTLRFRHALQIPVELAGLSDALQQGVASEGEWFPVTVVLQFARGILFLCAGDNLFDLIETAQAFGEWFVEAGVFPEAQ